MPPSPPAAAPSEGKKVHVVGFGSNYFHQFTHSAVPILNSNFLSRHCDDKNMHKELDMTNQGRKLLWGRQKLCNGGGGGDNIPSAFFVPLHLQENNGNNDPETSRNKSKNKEKLSASQRIKRIMSWRRKSRKQETDETKDYKIYDCNSNSNHGESSTAVTDNADCQQLASTSEPCITAISAGFTHSAFISKGQIYITGTIHGKVYVNPTIQVPKIPVKCTQISCGKRHVLALFENKTCMSMGSGYFGQLGNGFDVVNCEELTIIERLLPNKINGEVVRIEAGGMHSAAIVTKDPVSWKNKDQLKDIETTVLRWGSNKCGQCAIDGGEKCHAIGAIGVPTPMVEVKHPETGKKVSFIALSLSKLHSVGLSEQGQVYSWGITGRCGHGDFNLNLGKKSSLKMRHMAGITLPKRIEALRNIKIIQISSGDAHSLALSESGRVFSWGSNTNGQLGFGGHTMQLSPRSVIDLQFGLYNRGADKSKVELTKAAETDKTKEVYPIIEAKQSSSSPFDLSATVGQIFYPSTPQKKSSTKRHTASSHQGSPDPMIISPQITSVHAAGSYSAAVSSLGDLYTWGCGECEQLGHSIPDIELGPLPQTGTGLRIRDSKSFDSRLNILIPRRVDFLRRLGLKVDSVACSPHFMILTCSDIESNNSNDESVSFMGKTLFEHEIERHTRGLTHIRVIRSPT